MDTRRRIVLLSLASASFAPQALLAQSGCRAYGPANVTYRKHPGAVFEPSTAGWEAGGILHIAVVKQSGTYYMWYSAMSSPGYKYRTIGLATSNDGIAWRRASDRPVLTRGRDGSFDDVHVHMPTVLFDGQRKVFRMWYVGYQKGGGNSLGYAESKDGIAWTRQGQVLSYGAEGEFDSGSLREPSVIYDADERMYKMWYNGTRRGGHYGPTGYAVSADGLKWKKTRVVNEGPDDARGLKFIGIHVVRTSRSCYHGWYGVGSEIGYATSSDGVVWQPGSPEIVVTKTPKSFDERYLQAPVAIIDEGGKRIQLWYTGATVKDWVTVGYAEASIGS